MQEIAKKINSIGGRLYLVGGAVRDEIMGRKLSDEDYCVVGITQEEFQTLFPDAITRGKSFEVFDLYGREFAMARTETKVGKGHKEFEIQTSKQITIEEDLSRRDVTINSIAKDVLTGKIIDPFNGREDIQNKILRATTGKFKEDPLRVYRVARMAANFEFDVEEKTMELMKSLKNELNSLSPERVFVEFRKALCSNKPSIFFEVLRKTGLLEIHFKEISNLIGAEQPKKYHPEGDSYNHTMQALDKASLLTKDEKIKYAVLVHDLGKGLTPKEKYPHHYGHDKMGGPLVIDLSNRLKVPNSWKNAGKISALEHMKAGIFNEMSYAKQVDLIEKLNKSELGLEGMQIVVIADRWRYSKKPDGINFAQIGKRVLKEITGDSIIKKYKITDGIKIKEKLREERIKHLKDIEN